MSAFVARRMALPPVAAALLLATAAAAFDGPTMSRYRLRVPDGATVANLDPAIVGTLCKDEDGCAVVLTMESPLGGDWITTTRFRLTLSRSFDHTSWSRGATGRDNDFIVQMVASVSVGFFDVPNCILNDGDGATGTPDTGLGFSLVLSPADGGVCTVVISD